MADLSAGDIFMADLSTAEHLYSSYLNCGALYGSSLPHFFLRLVCRYFWRCFILSFESDKLYYIFQFLWFERRKIWCYFIVEMGWPSCLRTPIFHRPHLWGDLMAVVLKSAREQVFWFRRMSNNPWQLYKLTKDLVAMWYQVADVMDAILMIVKEEVRL